jgi:tetratricopeptide (TPR) repeat protein
MKTKMKIFLSILFLFLPLSIFPVDRIDLVKNCSDSNSCHPKTWYVLDSYDPSFLSLEKPGDEWKKVEAFPIWMNKLFTKEGELAVYTLMTYFDIPEDILNYPKHAGIRFGEIGEVFEIYLNGNLIAKEGEIKDGKVFFHRTVRGVVYQVPKEFMKANNNQLLVKLSGHPKFDHTGFYLTRYYDFGLYDNIKYDEQDRVTLALLTVYLTVGLYHLFLFYRRRIEVYNFYYGAFSFIVAVYIYTRSSAVFENPWDTSIIQRIELAVLYPGFSFLSQSLDYLFFNKARKWTKIYTYFSYIICGLTLICPEMYQAEYILRLWQISVLTCGIPLIGRIFYLAIKQEIGNAKRLLVGLVIFIIAAIYDILDSLVLNTGLSFSKYAFFIYILGFAGVLANRFISVHNEIEDLNKNLENKVDERTKALNETLQEVKLLKEHQDGDYFLTTLIIQPLASNVRGDDKVKIKILTHQKKKFEFKNKMHEIGGDICISEIIHLKGRKYTAFLNGDAMGKSIQGAGGALALGVVFKSILSRGKIFSKEESVFPERWLKLAFQELQSIFDTFDGSMMVSVVMGLVDNERGFIYYINAEHPFCVLYRDRKASFIEKELNLHKIGMMTAEYSGEFRINTFKLENEDIVLMGSDGKDDIKIGIDDRGGRVINEDESLFLKTVEEANADLEKIFSITENKGELTDDFSLLRIEYNEPYPEINDNDASALKAALEHYNKEEYKKANEVLAQLEVSTSKSYMRLKANIAYKLGDFKAASELYTTFIDLYPEEATFLFATAKSYKMIGNYELAADYSERLKLREPKNVNNLILLTEIYLELKAFIRARKMFDLVILLDRENPKLGELKNKLSVNRAE